MDCFSTKDRSEILDIGVIISDIMEAGREMTIEVRNSKTFLGKTNVYLSHYDAKATNRCPAVLTPHISF